MSTTTIRDFQIISRIGEGSYSSVYKVRRISDDKEYALKKVKLNGLSEKEKENALNEVRILASISNPYIIGYKEAFFDETSQCLCIIMEYASGGDMYMQIRQHLKKGTQFSEFVLWKYFIQMVRALKTLHDMKILHRDLKSANVFLFQNEENVKLGDLNVSKIVKNNLVYTQTGTPYYASPEVWRDEPYGLKSDIWSLGCVLYEMAALKPPFQANDMGGLYKKVQKGIYDRIPAIYSNNLAQVIDACVKVVPNQRLSCDELLNLQQVKKFIKENLQNEQPETNSALLGTIKLPKNLKILQERLPKSNYGPSKTEQNNKNKETYFLPKIQNKSPNIKPSNSIIKQELPGVGRIGQSVDSYAKYIQQQQQRQQQQEYNEQHILPLKTKLNSVEAQTQEQKDNKMQPIQYKQDSRNPYSRFHDNNHNNQSQMIQQDKPAGIPSTRAKKDNFSLPKTNRYLQGPMSKQNNYYLDNKNQLSSIFQNLYEQPPNPTLISHGKPVRPHWWG